ncbi:protein VACUOLELESS GAMETOPHYTES-like [Salvia miltiorrhiza]|uniref:protein VACUOLELESS GAMETOPHYTES-like n=1 Tax=Salvia miltiorrhiza TaxID=226208 RepID=UPI0025AD6BC5|nr:protein VACUOLELESS GAMETOPHYTES-like [Salvia miltiorrhiza]
MEQPTTLLKHFSHEHPLEYVESSFDGDRVCSACKLSIMPRNFFYECKLCRFSLHKVCYSMPKKVMHPADPNHCLKLLTSSTVAEKSDECEACGRHIAGFHYSCTKCSLYYHMLCVALPLSLKMESSHPHVLKLELKPLYDFECDVCDRPSYNGWDSAAIEG